MLKVNKFLNGLRNVLLIILILLTGSMFYIKNKMYRTTNNVKHLDRRIEKLNEEKELLAIELTYLSSAERILKIIDKNPEILNNKEIIKAKQIKNKEELVNIFLSNAIKNPQNNIKFVKNNSKNYF